MMARPAFWTTLAQWATGALLVYGALLAMLWYKQEALLFQPQQLPADHRFQHLPDVHEGWVEVPGARLNLLHLRLPQPSGVVFFLHGNGGSLQNWFVNIDFYRAANFDIVMPDFRGYGKSTGAVSSQAQLLDDMRAVWRSVAPGYAQLPRVFMGRSLGTGLVAALAVEEAPELTVLVSPYFSMQALAAEHYPWVPSALLRYPLQTDQLLPLVKTPVLLLHGDRDRLIDASHSKRLQTAAPNAKLVMVAGASHNDLQAFAPYSQALAAALQEVAGRR